jgi:OmcA/MtrC family decaheme c-type cytochrome
MNRFDGILRSAWSILIAGALAFAVVGCEGDTGPAGPAGPAGADGQDGEDGVGIQPIDQVMVESCSTCHQNAGGGHQALYEGYIDSLVNSAFEMTFTSFTSAPGVVAGEFDGTLNVTILKNGLPFTDLQALQDAGSEFAQAYFAVVDYDGPNQDYSQGRQQLRTITQPTPGNYVITGTGLTFNPTINGQVYGYIAETPLFEHEGGTGGEIPAGSHVHLYENVANAAIAFGDAQLGSANEYVSAANVAGCEKCHGKPYFKHGYRAAEVAGIPDFSACKTCHYSGRNGFVPDWQYMVDDPLAWATGENPTADYTYEGSIMNDTHMSHAMEFPYPQSMQGCNTCHEGMIDTILADTNFTGEVCASCHPVQGINAWPGELYNQPARAPALEYLWQRGADLTFHDITADCQSCHGAGVSGSFTAYHTGYDVNIYDATGQKYSDLYSVSIDAIAYDATTGLITVDFSANDPAIVPELYISFYGWDSRHFYVGAHERDSQTDVCTGGFRPGCQMEYVPDSRSGSVDPNPIFIEDAASSPTAGYKVTADPSQWLLTKTDLVPDLIADGTIRRIEVTVAPELNLSDLATPGPNVDVVLTAANQTFVLGTGLVDDTYFKGEFASVSTEKCNVCHDALASTFHSQSGRAGDGIEVCKNCHTTTFGGSHIEMASRSIDNYIHSIHSFQAFDIDDTFDTFDAVFSRRYDQHIKHTFPNFTIRNCEACHVGPGVYDVPDQSLSMFGLQASSMDVLTWYDIVKNATTGRDMAVEDTAGRTIGTVPRFVVGPASRACGGCHRADFINADAAGDLASFNAHTESFGTLVDDEAVDDSSFLFDAIDKIMGFFY